MSKRLTRVLSLVLTLVMFLSVSTPAFAIGGGDMGRDFGRDIGENEIRDFEPAGEIAEEEELDYFQTTVEANGSQVTVEAPMGALPTLAELRAETVEVEDVREAVESVLEGEANILLAMDISFWLNGIEIEPEEPVRVKISAPELDGKDNLTLVHIPDAAEPETIDLIDEDQVSFALGSNEIAFQADSFSIYAVVEPAITPRLAYHFMSGTTEFNTQYIKKTEIDGETYYDELYMPNPVAEYGQTFIGWTYDPENGEVVDFEQIKTDRIAKLDALTENDDMTDVYVYAVFHEAYILRYLKQLPDESLSVISAYSVAKDETDQSKFKVVLDDYDEEEGEVFLGWIEVGSGTIYQPYTEIDLRETGNLDLYVNLDNYFWLVFDSNATSSATYTPPELLNGQTEITEKPDDPTRLGYLFKGWNTEPDGSGETWLTVTYDADGKNPSYSNNKFGDHLTSHVKLYAQWEAADTTYTVVFWKQKSSATGTDPKTDYDFAESIVRTAKTDETAATTNADRTKGGTQNSSYGYYFTYNGDISDTSKTVAGDGSTVLNVYYDRRTITYNFVNPTATTATYGRYGYINGQYVQLYYETWTGGHSAVGNNDTHDTVYYRVSYYGNYYYYEYTGTRYSGNSGTNTQTFSGLYQSAFTEWPNPGSGMVWYNSSEQVYFPLPLTQFDPAAVYTEVTNQTSATFVLSSESYANTLTLYKMTVDGEWEYTQDNVITTAMIGDNWTPTETFEGFTLDSYRRGNGEWTSVTPTTRIGDINTDIDLRFTRNQHDIVFISEGAGATGRQEKLETGVYYEAPMSTYGQNEDGDWYYEPTNGQEGYYFAGWYEDAALSTPYDFSSKTMPNSNVTLYAKWDTFRVRVVLVPTKNNANNSEVNFANNQALAFRLDYNERVSDANITGTAATRNGYYLVGWFTDPNFSPASRWNFETPVNKDVPAVDMTYQDSEDWANNTYGDNDGKHENVKGILKLYAKWALAEPGKVYVRYVVEDQYLVKSGSNIVTVVPYDKTAYVLDGDNEVKPVVIGDAPTDYVEGFVFTDWGLMNPRDNTLSEKQYLPTSTETIPGSYIKTETVTDDEGNEGTISYITFVGRFVADSELGIATMVTFDGNGGVTNDANAQDSITKAYLVNETLDIPAADAFVREGCTLVGWSFYKNLTAEDYAKLADGDTVDVTIDGEAVTLTKDDVFAPGSQAAADNLDKTSLNNKDNILYAVWDGAFYIYHSSNATVEKVSISALDEDGKYDIVAKTAANFLYGGYYKDYSQKGEYDLENPQEGEFGTAYEGDTTSWKAGDALSESGFAMTPVMNHTYFLKEVPNTYLMPTQIETFNRYNYELRHLIFTTAIDDNNYKSNGFTVAGNTEDGVRTPVVTLTFGANSEKDKVELEAKDVANVENGLVGFYCEFNSLDSGKHTDLIAAKAMSVKPYWVTPDGVTVTGSGLRRVLIVDKNENSIVEVGTMAEVTYRNYKSAITAKAA